MFRMSRVARPSLSGHLKRIVSVAVLLSVAVTTLEPVDHFEMVELTAIVMDGDIPTAVHVSVPSPHKAREIARLSRLNGFVSVGESSPLHIMETWGDPYVDRQWGLTRLDASILQESGADGAGVVVAVLDTGVDATHPDLQGRVLSGFDVYNPNGDGRKDPNGHGTHVAGIIAAGRNAQGGQGLASGAQILPVRVLDETGYGDDSDVARGVIWAVAHGAQIINMSLGGEEANTQLAEAVAGAIQAGVVVVAAAGNGGALQGGTVYPAANPGVIGVAATGGDDRAAWFSTRGSWVDIAAPGVGILSTWPGGGWEFESGTSMASPMFAAAVAVVAQGAAITPAAAAARLLVTATDVPVGSSSQIDGRDNSTGAGLVDPITALRNLSPRQLSDRSVVPQSQLPVNVTAPTLELPKLVLPTLPPLETPNLPLLPPTKKPTSPSLPNQIDLLPTLPRDAVTNPGQSDDGKKVTPSPSGTVRPETGGDGLVVTAERRWDRSVVVRIRRSGLPVRSVLVTFSVGKTRTTRRTDLLGKVTLPATKSSVTVVVGKKRIIVPPAR